MIYIENISFSKDESFLSKRLIRKDRNILFVKISRRLREALQQKVQAIDIILSSIDRKSYARDIYSIMDPSF